MENSSILISYLMSIGALLLIMLPLNFLIYKVLKQIDNNIKLWENLIPIYNLYIFNKIAYPNHKWTFILLLIPFVNIPAFMYAWQRIFEKLGKSDFNGLFWATMVMLTFGLVLIFFAFNKKSKKIN